MWVIREGDCRVELKNLADDSVDAVVTDPPYNLSFMGKGWDKFSPLGYQSWCEDWATECLRVLKPGGYLLACGGTRTYHRMTTGIEDAGFEIRDSLIWLHGQGFPKSRDIGKAIDSEAGAEREVIGPNKFAGTNGKANLTCYGAASRPDETTPATADAQQWAGWGTALKPSHEPIVMARKPFKGTVASNVLQYGTGAINVDGCRVGTESRVNQPAGNKPGSGVYQLGITGMPPDADPTECQGRWPANVVLSHSADCVPSADWPLCVDGCPVAELDRQSGQSTSRIQPKTERKGGKATDFAMRTSGATHEDSGGASRFFMQCAPDCPVAELDRQSGVTRSTVRVSEDKDEPADTFSLGRSGITPRGHSDQGGASRFFYCAKASKAERPHIEGLEGHPTVKPLSLMRWLVRMVCPPGGLVLDPFAGTGTTGEAAWLEGFRSLLIESDVDSIRRIEKRMSKYTSQSEIYESQAA